MIDKRIDCIYIIFLIHVIAANSITVWAPTSQSSALPTTVPGSPTTSSATSKYSVEVAHYLENRELNGYQYLRYLLRYRNIPKIGPGASIFQRPLLRGLFLEGFIFGGAYLRREIDWVSLIVGSKFTVFAMFYFVFEGNFPSTSPRGAYIWRGDLTEGFLCYRFGGLIFGEIGRAHV